MTWAAPAALAGLAFLALPVLIHLMGVGRATVRRFPSLRFIPGTRLPPVRRHRLHDVPLLLLRMLAIAVATLAAARPVVRGAAPPAATHTIRAVVADTAGPGGVVREAVRRAADSARRAADVAAVVATGDAAGVIPGAVAWLAEQAGRRELVVVSDFRMDGLDSTDLAIVPAQYGIRLVRPAEARASATPSVSGVADGRRVTVRASVMPGRTDVTWTGDSRAPAALPLVFGIGGSDSVAIVARTDGPRGDTVALAPPRTPRDGDVIAALHLDPDVLRAADGFRAGVVRAGSRDRLTIVSPGGPASAATAALAVAAERASHGVARTVVRDPALRPDSVLGAWARPAGTDVRASRVEESSVLAQVLWTIALIALGAEFAVRRRIERSAKPGEADHARR